MARQLSESFSDISALAQELRDFDKKYVALFAHNGVGKTSLSVEFKNKGKVNGGRDTLYFNAFTEDLFYWDNDLDNDEDRVLIFHKESHFFDGLDAGEMETNIRALLARYYNFDFSIKFDVPTEKGTINYITFSREVFNEPSNTTELKENIKISRGEECLFKWCFFLSIVKMVVNNSLAYSWVKYVFIDDPISSLDDNNVVIVANQLASFLRNLPDRIHIIISTHHSLFYNVMCNELKLKEDKAYYLFKERDSENDKTYIWKTKPIRDTPFFQHLALIKELEKAVSPNGMLYTYHFNILRNILEKTAAFHGLEDFSKCIKKFDNDPDEAIYSRMINIFSHGNYSVFEPVEMTAENKLYFKQIYHDFMIKFPFNHNM